MDSALLASLSDREVAERWFPARPRERAEGYLHPDLDACAERKGAYRRLPLKQLWYKYRDSAGREGLKAHGYQAFRRMFAARAAQLDVTARLEHVPGDKVSGDWTGDRPHLTNPVTGRRMKAQVFVAVLPYSGLIFARATPDRRMASWLEAHRNMLEWFEGVPNMLVPDQCATAVDRTPRGLMETRRRQAVSGIRRALRDRGRAGARVRDHETRRRCGEAVDLVGQWIVEPSRDETFRTIMDPGRLHRRTGHVAQPPARHSGAGFEAGTVPGPGNDRCCRLASRGAVRPLPVEEGQGA